MCSDANEFVVFNVIQIAVSAASTCVNILLRVRLFKTENSNVNLKHVESLYNAAMKTQLGIRRQTPNDLWLIELGYPL